MVVTGAFGPFGGGLLGSVSGGLDSALCRPSWSMPALARGRHASASASPSLGPGNGILRAETGGGFQAQNAGEWPEFCSQIALRPSAPPMCATREAICTAIPFTSSSANSTSPVCTPMRTGTSSPCNGGGRAGAKPFELAPPLPQRRVVRFRRSRKRSRRLASLRLASKWGASGAYRSADRAALRNGQLA